MAQVTLADAFYAALAHHQAGRLSEAEGIYRQIVAQVPDQVDTLHMLGTLQSQRGKLDEAIELLSRAIAIRPDVASFHSNLAETCRLAGKLDQAIASARRALELDPNFAEAHNNLGVSLKDQGQLEAAISSFQRAVELRPDYAAAHNNLGIALTEKGDEEKGLAALQRATKADPKFADPHCNIGAYWNRRGKHDKAIASFQEAIRLRNDFPEAIYNLASSLLAKGRLDEAMAAAQNALRLKPGYVYAINTLGTIYREQKKFPEALEAYRKVVAQWPEFAEGHSNMGNALYDMGRHDEAIAACSRAIELNPNSADLHYNLGNPLHAQGKYRQALEEYLKCAELDKNHGSGHWNAALTMLLLGDFERGWKEYEWRWNSQKATPRPKFQKPMWDGSALDGRTILVYSEQGFGDTFHFIRYLPMVKARGGRIVFPCFPELFELLRDLPWAEKFFLSTSPAPEFELHCPLLSLPMIFKTRLDSIPADVPYIMADAKLAATWADRIAAAGERLKVGLVWAGRPTHPKDRSRSISLSTLAPLFSIPGIRFFSLQKGEAARQVAREYDLIDHTESLSDFSQTAAMIANLDLVVTVDTAVAHLTGAMAKPVWLLLSFVPDWRWMLERTDSPWYPTARLFRQPAIDQWGPVVAELGEAMKDLLNSPKTP